MQNLPCKISNQNLLTARLSNHANPEPDDIVILSFLRVSLTLHCRVFIANFGLSIFHFALDLSLFASRQVLEADVETENTNDFSDFIPDGARDGDAERPRDFG